MKHIIRNILGITIIIIMSLVIVNLVENEDEDAVKGNITIWASNDSYEYLLKSAEEFKEVNVKANIEIVKVEEENYKSKVEEVIANSNTNINNINNNVPDIVELGSSDIVGLSEKYADNIYNVENIIDVCLKNYTSNRLSEVTIDGEILGIPTVARPLILYLRQDMLKEYGYSYENITTWDEFIAMGKDIYARSNGNIKVLNAVDKDYEDLLTVLIMQAMEESTDEEKIKENVNNMLNQLTNDNMLNKDTNGEFLARISSNNSMKELSKLDVKCEWTANDMLSKYNGSNRFYVAEGKNLVVLKENEKTTKLIRKFVDYLSNNSSEAVDYVNNGDFFSSFLSTYKNKDIEVNVDNFVGRSPIVAMDNIYKKAPTFSNYDLFFKIKDQYIY